MWSCLALLQPCGHCDSSALSWRGRRSRKAQGKCNIDSPMWRDPVIKELPLIWFIIDFIYLIANFDMIVHDDDRLVVEEQISRCPSPQLRTWERRAFRFLWQNKRLGASGLVVNLYNGNSEYHVRQVWFSNPRPAFWSLNDVPRGQIIFQVVEIARHPGYRYL